MPTWPELASPELALLRHIEQLSLSAWPALQTIFFDGWIIRFSKGYTKRSNSVVPLFPGTRDVERKIEYCRQMYDERNLPTIFKLTETSGNAALDEFLSCQGFDQIDETMVQTCLLSPALRVSRDSLSVQNEFSPEWVKGFFECSALREPAKRAAARALLTHIAERVVAVRKVVDGKTTGCGFGVVQGSEVGLFDISVHKDFRRRRIGTEIVTTILNRARDMGARRAYLQVVADNEPAVELYKRLGFKEVYRYCYRIKAPS